MQLKLEYLAVYGRASAVGGGGRLGLRHDFVMDGMNRDYLSRASQSARCATKNQVSPKQIIATEGGNYVSCSFKLKKLSQKQIQTISTKAQK